MLAFRSLQQSNHRVGEDVLHELKPVPAGGLRPPSGPAATRRSRGRRPHRALGRSRRFMLRCSWRQGMLW
jgi:hypothetical protein